MDDEKLIEILKSQIYKLENDLKVKLDTERHLIYENETLYTENEKLLKKCLEEEEIINKLKNEIKKLKNYIEDLDNLRIDNEKLLEENKQIKYDLNELIKVNKSLKKPMHIQVESPNAKLKEIEYQYNSEIKDLKEKNQLLLETVETHKVEFEKIVRKMKIDTEIMESKIENYKEIIAETKKEKEELELVYVNLQNDFNKPDFNRQGNNMYIEVDDRRIKAEKALLTSLDQNKIMRTRVSALRVYLEKAFATFSEMKEEELNNYKRDLFEEQTNLQNEIQVLKNNNYRMKQHIEDKLKSGIEINTNEQVGILQIQMKILNSEKVATEKKLSTATDSLDRMRKDRNKAYQKAEQLTFEKSSFQTKLEKLESKLSFIELKIPKEILEEYEEQEKFNEETSQLKHTPNNQFLPPSIFGPYYQDAKYSDKLVFDHFGDPIPNKLTKKIFPDIDKKEVTQIVVEQPKEISTSNEKILSVKQNIVLTSSNTKEATTFNDKYLSCKDANKTSDKCDSLTNRIDHTEPTKSISDSQNENLPPAGNIQYADRTSLEDVHECKVS